MGNLDSANRIWDVIVIGAGPAGAISALLAARQGAATLLVERKPFPRAKVCGGCLNAAAVGLLDSLGLGGIARGYGLPIDHLELGLNGRRARLGLPGGVAIQRSRFDAELVRQAQVAGAEFLPGTRAVLGDDDGSSREVILIGPEGERPARGRAVVAAAGLGGPATRGEPIASTRVSPRSRIGAGCLVEWHSREYPVGRISMAIGRSGYVGLTPTVDGLAIASATDAEFLRERGGPARAAASILENAGFPPVPGLLSAEWSGTLPLTRSTRPVGASRVFLVGDAAGYVEPFTGQGMAIALQGAAALAPYVTRAVEGWSPAIARGWCRAYAREIGSRHWPAALVATLARRPALASLAFAAAGAIPSLPRTLVRIVNRPALIHDMP